MGSNIVIGLTFVIFLNVLIFLASAAVDDMNPGSRFYNVEGSPLDTIAGGDYDNPVIDPNKISEALPEGEGSIAPDTGNFFTDTFGSIKKWITGLPGINYVYGMVMAPYNMLKLTNLPAPFVFAIGGLWHLLTLFLVVAFFWGKE